MTLQPPYWSSEQSSVLVEEEGRHHHADSDPLMIDGWRNPEVHQLKRKQRTNNDDGPSNMTTMMGTTTTSTLPAQQVQPLSSTTTIKARRVAIVGSGISGLSCAHLLSQHQVTSHTHPLVTDQPWEVHVFECETLPVGFIF